MVHEGHSKQPVAVMIGQILLLEQEIRQEQTSVERAGLSLGVLGEPVPPERVARLEHFHSAAKKLFPYDAYRHLRMSPARLGLLWGDYVDTLRTLRDALKERRQQLAETRAGED